MNIHEKVQQISSRLIDAGRAIGIELGMESALHATFRAANSRGLVSCNSASKFQQLLEESGFSYKNNSTDFSKLTSDQCSMILDYSESEYISNIEFYHYLYEKLLISLARFGGSSLKDHFTDGNVAALMVARVQPGESIVDPACGFGSILMAAAVKGATRLRGFEVSPKAALVALMRLSLANVDAEITLRNSLDGLGSESQMELFDHVAVEPPFDAKSAGPSHLSDEEWPGLKRLGDAVWLIRALQMVKPEGQVCALLPISSTYGKTGEVLINSFVKNGQVLAVVKLPRQSKIASSAESCLWYLETYREESFRSVLLVDLGRQEAIETGEPEPSTSRYPAQLLSLLPHSGEPTAATSSRVSISVSPDDIIYEKTVDPIRFLPEWNQQVARSPSSAQPLISEIRLSNFKAFGETSKLPLKPLTLLYGKNSAGKSSIIQALQLLRQSVNHGSLQTQGEFTDAGEFSSIVTNHDTSKEISIGLSYYPSFSSFDSSGRAHGDVERRVDFSFSKTDGETGRASTKVRFGFGNFEVDFDYFDSEHDTYSNQRTGYIELNAENVAHVVEMMSDKRIYAQPTNTKKRRPVTVISNLKKFGLDVSKIATTGLIPDGTVLSKARRGGASAQQSFAAERVIAGVAHELSAFIGVVFEHIVSMHHAGPLRAAPKRVHSRTQGVREEDDVAFKLFDKASEQSQVSQWLSDLGIPYALSVVPVSSIETVELTGELVAIRLQNRDTHFQHSPVDVGFGVSQVLPILAELALSESRLICIEQPEIHLHPAMQSELADILVASMDSEGRNNQIVVETHSEHLMMRIQRRIREGSLAPGDVCVLYVDQDEGGFATATELRLDSDGDFTDPWPHGFFDERFDDLMAAFE